MSKPAAVNGLRAESPKPPAGPGDLSEEQPASEPARKDEPKRTPPAGPGKFPSPSDVPSKRERGALATEPYARPLL